MGDGGRRLAAWRVPYEKVQGSNALHARLLERCRYLLYWLKTVDFCRIALFQEICRVYCGMHETCAQCLSSMQRDIVDKERADQQDSHGWQNTRESSSAS